MITELASDVRLWSAIAIAGTTYILLLPPTKPPFPTINSYPWDIFSTRAHAEAQANARGLIERATSLFPDTPFTIAVPPRGYKIILPSSLVGWVRSRRELDHTQLVRDDYFAGLPGFECQTVLHHDDGYVKKLITTRLGQNESALVAAAMNPVVASALGRLWGESPEWRSLADWHADTTGVIARAASSVFVGPEMAGDSEWLALVQDYVSSYFGAVGELHGYPAWTRGFVQRFVSARSRRCRALVARARVVIEEVLEERSGRVARARAEGREEPVYNDVLEWSRGDEKGKEEECRHHPADVQLSLAMAAMFTTSEMFRQVLIDLAREQDMVEVLRAEVREKLGEYGVSAAALREMVVLDSFLKESQRLSAPPAVVERAVVKDTALPDGRVLPRGAHLLVDSTHLLNSTALYGPDPSAFDGYRFLRRHEAGDKSAAFVQSSSTFVVFGVGRYICPGRFLAGNELKLALAHVLLKYDIRHKEGSGGGGKPLGRGFFTVVNPSVQMEVRRREDAGEAKSLGLDG